MSIARHAEWLSLLEVFKPFLSIPVLLNPFLSGLVAGLEVVILAMRASR